MLPGTIVMLIAVLIVVYGGSGVLIAINMNSEKMETTQELQETE